MFEEDPKYRNGDGGVEYHPDLLRKLPPKLSSAPLGNTEQEPDTSPPLHSEAFGKDEELSAEPISPTMVKEGLIETGDPELDRCRAREIAQITFRAGRGETIEPPKPVGTKNQPYKKSKVKDITVSDEYL